MLEWRLGGESLLGIFFVPKKNGKLRIILDTRDVNGFFSRPPSTRLPSAAAFSSLETWPLVEDTGEKKPIFFSSGDIMDCFYHCGVPPGLEQWFSLPAIRARHVSHVRIPGKHIHPSALLVPCLKVLPMGWSWSLHIAQRMHEYRIAESGLSRSSRIVDRRPPWRFGPRWCQTRGLR